MPFISASLTLLISSTWNASETFGIINSSGCFFSFEISFIVFSIELMLFIITGLVVNGGLYVFSKFFFFSISNSVFFIISFFDSSSIGSCIVLPSIASLLFTWSICCSSFSSIIGVGIVGTSSIIDSSCVGCSIFSSSIGSTSFNSSKFSSLNSGASISITFSSSCSWTDSLVSSLMVSSAGSLISSVIVFSVLSCTAGSSTSSIIGVGTVGTSSIIGSSCVSCAIFSSIGSVSSDSSTGSSSISGVSISVVFSSFCSLSILLFLISASLLFSWSSS